jgi:hypothetical protein
LTLSQEGKGVFMAWLSIRKNRTRQNRPVAKLITAASGLPKFLPSVRLMPDWVARKTPLMAMATHAAATPAAEVMLPQSR